tara:strand:+ start:2945 stop:3565 length:621 start_codon:yes stop_codon:yes gene_type:complete
MVFVVEISFYLHHHGNNSAFKNSLIEIAENNGCLTHYFMDETRGNNFVMIHVVHFSSEIKDTWLACNYIKEIKKTNQVLIESVYYDAVKGQILYASREYMKNMEKECGLKMKTKKNKNKESVDSLKPVSMLRQRSYSESELMMLSALNKHKKSSKRSKKILNDRMVKVENKSENKSRNKGNEHIISYEKYLSMIGCNDNDSKKTVL